MSSSSKSTTNTKFMPDTDGYTYYMHEDDQNDRDDELKSRVLTRTPACMMSAQNHDITDLLDEVLDSDDSEIMYDENAMEIDNKAKKTAAEQEIHDLFAKKSQKTGMKKSKSLEHIPESVVTVLSAAARASNTSLEKLGYETEDDKMDENDENGANVEITTKKVHFEDDKMAENDEMADSGNTSANSPEKNMPNHPDTQKAKYNAKSTTKQLTTADELLEDQQDFLDLFKNGRYGLNADDLYDEEADDLDEKYRVVLQKSHENVRKCLKMAKKDQNRPF